MLPEEIGLFLIAIVTYGIEKDNEVNIGWICFASQETTIDPYPKLLVHNRSEISQVQQERIEQRQLVFVDEKRREGTYSVTPNRSPSSCRLARTGSATGMPLAERSASMSRSGSPGIRTRCPGMARACLNR